MIYVVVEELIPEAQHEGRTDLATSGTIIGFAIMMLLDVALGGPPSALFGAEHAS